MSWLAAFSLVLGVTQQAAQSPIQILQPASAIAKREPQLAKWVAGEVTCDNGQTFPGSTLNPPVPQKLMRRPDPSPAVTYEFTLGEEGRPLSVLMVADGKRRVGGGDIPGAIAGTPFPNLDEPTRCSVTFTHEIGNLIDAELEDVVRLRSYLPSAQVPAEFWRRFAPGNCQDKPRQRPLMLAFPDFRALPKPNGTRDWVFITFDTNSLGSPVNLSVVDSSGSDALNAAGEAAIAKSVYTETGRIGCFRFFWTSAGVVEAPHRPEIETYGAMPEACRADDRWDRKPTLTYPEIYRRRGIEGWATLKYDVAPWGEIGNIEVLDAQPTDDFSRFAIPVLKSATYVERDSGLTGCIERVVFRLPEPGSLADTEGEE